MRKTLIVLALACSTSCQSTSSVEPTESYVQTSDGLLLHFRKFGEGPGLMIVPGGSWTADDMKSLAKNTSVVFYDARNRGRSEGSTISSLDTDLQDLETMQEWFGVERVSLLGIDYNAALVALYAARHPERVDRLVVASPMPVRKNPYWNIYRRVFEDRQDAEAFKELRMLKSRMANKLDQEGWANAYRDALLTGWLADQSSIHKVKSNPFVPPNMNPELQLHEYILLLKSLGDWDWRGELADVECMTVVAYGAHDPVPLESTREWVDTIPGAGSLEFKDSSRLPWVEQSGDFFKAMDKFLSREP